MPVIRWPTPVIVAITILLLKPCKWDYLCYNYSMARPQKDRNERKDVDLRIPVTLEQKGLIVRAARLDGMDMAAWVRPFLLREAQKRVKKGNG